MTVKILMQIAFLMNVKNFQESRVFHNSYNSYWKEKTSIMYKAVLDYDRQGDFKNSNIPYNRLRRRIL